MLQKLTRAMPPAPNISDPISDVLTLGTIGVGKPAGTDPTTATPLLIRLKANTATQPAVTAINGAGTLGKSRLSRSSSTSRDAPTMKVGMCVSLKCDNAPPTLRKNPPGEALNPNNDPSCPA